MPLMQKALVAFSWVLPIVASGSVGHGAAITWKPPWDGALFPEEVLFLDHDDGAVFLQFLEVEFLLASHDAQYAVPVVVLDVGLVEFQHLIHGGLVEKGGLAGIGVACKPCQPGAGNLHADVPERGETVAEVVDAFVLGGLESLFQNRHIAKNESTSATASIVLSP